MRVLEGKVAIVTGGSSGIGEEIAARFVGQGAHVVIAARRKDEGDRVAARLGVDFVAADVSIEDDVRALVAYTERTYGHVDCLVNNASISTGLASICDVDMAELDRILAVNVRGPVLGIKHVAPSMIRRARGSIINVSSVAGLLGGLSAHPYSASKGAIIQLTRSVAAELGEKNVRVNCISPGSIVTGIFGKIAGMDATQADRITETVEALFATVQTIPRAGMPNDIAEAALYLAGDGASFVNGQNLVVDGGMTSTFRLGWSDTKATRARLSEAILAEARTAEP
jgi:NAD(P)-dependent dehydrogenase (short-subunit alcohol dehydrogenase family)